jgi:hypothetical protein
MRAFLVGIALLGLTAASASACGIAPPKGAAAPHAALGPAIGAKIDGILAHEPPTPDVVAKVQALHAQIVSLVAAGKTDQALAVEKDAMKLLGYEKRYLRCGPGSFAWFKLRA